MKSGLNRFLRTFGLFWILFILSLWTWASSSDVEDCGLRDIQLGDARSHSPWTAAIFVRSSLTRPWKYLLAGTILNPTTILTLYGGAFGSPNRGSKYIIPPPNKLKILAGLPTSSLDSADEFTQEANISYVFPFTKHRNKNGEYHLYVVHLATPLHFETPFVKALCLPSSSGASHQDLLRKDFLLGGFAPSWDNGLGETLMVKPVEILPSRGCQEEFRRQYNDSGQSVICAKQRPAGTRIGEKTTCILHGATLFSSPAPDYENPGEIRWSLVGLLAIIPSLKKTLCTSDSLYMITNLEDAIPWIWQNIRCGPGRFPCPSGRCIDSRNVCNGIDNCRSSRSPLAEDSNSDEDPHQDTDDENPIFCQAANHCRRQSGAFSSSHSCGLNQECISPWWLCDGHKDCDNGADESPSICKPGTGVRSNFANNKVYRRETTSGTSSGVSGICLPLQLTEGVVATCKNPSNNQDIKCDQAQLSDEMTLECDDQFRSNYRASSLKMTCTVGGAWKPFRPFYCERECGIINSGVTFKLSHGRKTSHKNAFPWYAAIYRRMDDQSVYEFICGGSLIEPRIILSAAHCVITKAGYLEEPGVFRVVLAPISTQLEENVLDAYAQIIGVRSVHIPDSFDPKTLQSDIAILELEQEAIFNNFVRPVCYMPPFYTEYPSPGITGKVAGLGYDESNQLSTIIKFTKFPVVSQETCSQALGHIPPLKTFCAGYQNGTAVCRGDSGGGLVFPVTAELVTRYVLKGIVSHGLVVTSRICDRENYSVFTNVDSYGDWIAQILENIEAGGIKSK